MFETIDKIELSDNKMFYYNYYEKLLRLFIDSFELIKVDEKDSHNASIEDLRKYNDKIDNIIFEINRVMKLMLK